MSVFPPGYDSWNDYFDEMKERAGKDLKKSITDIWPKEPGKSGQVMRMNAEKGHLEWVDWPRFEPCPLCKSRDIQVCMDSNNPIKDICRCRNCECRAPREAWQNYRR